MPGFITERSPRYHFILDDSDVVIFVGTQQEVAKYFKSHGGSKRGLHLMYSDIEQDGKRLPRPVVGKVLD